VARRTRLRPAEECSAPASQRESDELRADAVAALAWSHGRQAERQATGTATAPRRQLLTSHASARASPIRRWWVDHMLSPARVASCLRRGHAIRRAPMEVAAIVVRPSCADGVVDFGSWRAPAANQRAGLGLRSTSLGRTQRDAVLVPRQQEPVGVVPRSATRKEAS